MELICAVMSSSYNHLIFQTEPKPAGFCPTTALQGYFKGQVQLFTKTFPQPIFKDTEPPCLEGQKFCSQPWNNKDGQSLKDTSRNHSSQNKPKVPANFNRHLPSLFLKLHKEEIPSLAQTIQSSSKLFYPYKDFSSITPTLPCCY